MLPAEELQVSLEPQLQLFRDRAWQLHSLRNAQQPTVSRSTLLYTAATISPLVLAALEINGLNVRAWEHALGFDERPSLPTPETAGDNFHVHPDTAATLAKYPAQWPERQLDVLGVVAAIFQELSGNARKHITSAGLDLGATTNQLVELVNVSPDGLVDYPRLGILLSERVVGIFNAARTINLEFNVRYRALTASQIAIAAASFVDDDPAAAPRFLHDYIRRHCSADQFGTLIRNWMSWYDQGTTTRYDRWTQTLTAIVLRAQQLTQRSRNRPEVAARHLIGALIACDRWAANSGVPRLFAEAGINQRKLARAYFETYLSSAPVDDTQPGRDNLTIWSDFLGLSRDTFVPRFNAEDLAGDDLLNVMDKVDAFASLVASNRIDPPLSIGLFGDWGSGKSFFMAKMREAIAERAQRAAGRSDSAFHRRIVQIDFNAWHYVEANLWASMVEHLFRNLKLTYEQPNAETVTARREGLLKELDQLMAERVVAEEKVEKAEIERDRAAQELDAMKKSVDASAAAARNLRAKDVWDLLTINEEERRPLQEALDKLGVGKVLESAADVRKTVDELRSVHTRTSLLGNWIFRQPKSILLLLAFLVAAPFLAMGIAAATNKISPEMYAGVGKSLSQVTAFVAVITGWLAQRMSAGKKILGTIDISRGKIDRLIERAADDIRQEVRSADDALATAAAAVTKAQETVISREEAVVVAKNELLKLTNGYRLNRFIDERAASDDYRKLLGVLATVRSDFATLSDLMHPRTGKSDLGDDLRIDRIILYIDDLDRCEPDRVIEVLQAVHLLLAFKLFVVVVGVDARWVSESLRQKHRTLRGVSNRSYESEDDVAGYAVEPHDYLEKIFQVPFWLDVLKPKTAGTYIANLLTADVSTESPIVQTPADAESRGGAGRQSTAAQQHNPDGLHTMSDDDDDSDPKELIIERKERDYMRREELARLVSRSPRTAKRFVNTYRFFRATIPRDSLARYLQDAPPAEYRCALLMLAIVVGAPDISLELFEQMRVADPRHGLDIFVATVKTDKDHDAEWKIVIRALIEFGEAERASLLHLVPHIDVSRYSFRPPNKPQKTRVPRAPEYVIRIKNDKERSQPPM